MARRIPWQKLQAAKKVAKANGTLPEPQKRPRRRRRGKAARRITFNYQVGDLVVIHRVPTGVPCRKGDAVLIAEADAATNRFGISTAHGVIVVNGGNLRPVDKYDDDEE